MLTVCRACFIFVIVIKGEIEGIISGSINLED